MLGLIAVHVNRVLQSFRNDGLIERSAGCDLIIREWDLLRQIAGFQPGYLHLGDVEADIADSGPRQASGILRNMADKRTAATANG